MIADLKRSIKEGAIRRAKRDRQLAEEWMSLEDEDLIRRGKAQPKRGKHIRWEDLKKT